MSKETQAKACNTDVATAATAVVKVTKSKHRRRLKGLIPEEAVHQRDLANDTVESSVNRLISSTTKVSKHLQITTYQ